MNGDLWSETDLFDLRNDVAQGTPIECIALFLCRDIDEVRAKIDDLGLKPASA